MEALLRNSQPHDWFFRGAFSKKVAAEFLTNHESPDYLSKINLDGLSIESNHFQSLNGSLIADLIISVPLRENPKQVVSYCIEHQSKADSLMPVRMIGYKAALLRRSAKEGLKYLPIVKSMVLYTGKKHYPDKINLSSLSEMPSNWNSFDNEAAFQLIWSQKEEQSAKGKYYPLVLKAFNIRYDRKLKKVEELFVSLSKFDSPEDKEFVKLLRRYVYIVRPDNEADDIIKLELAIEVKKGGEKMRSAAECLERRGGIGALRKYKGTLEERGKKEGLVLGRLEGKLEGKQECVQQVALVMRKKGIPENLINEITTQSLCESY